MKKVLFLFVSTLVLGLTSCNKDDDKSNSASIEGKWEYFQEGVLVGAQEFLEAYEHECETKKDYVEFLAGGIMNDVTYWNDCSEDTSIGVWVKNGNTLAIAIEGESVNAEILTLNNETLKVKATVEGVTFIQVFRRR